MWNQEEVAQYEPSVEERLSHMKRVFRHAYLETCRKIPASELQSWRLKGRVLEDRYHNAVFPHWDGKKWCGYEVRSEKFKGFAKGGVRGLWVSKFSDEDHELACSESAPKAISYSVLHSDGHMRLLSTAGTISDCQIPLLADAIRLLPPDGIVTAARDNDKAGDRWCARLREAFQESCRHDVRLGEHRPDEEFKDWGDALQACDPGLIREARVKVCGLQNWCCWLLAVVVLGIMFLLLCWLKRSVKEIIWETRRREGRP